MERPIIFSTEMVKAILEGRKTQTRRVIKKAPYVFRNGKEIPVNIDTSSWIKLCPYGQVGDRLWVRETWCCKVDPITARVIDGECWYQAANPEVIKVDGDGGQEFTKAGYEASPWLPSIHMPRWASRLTLEITEVRVERLQEITEKDALAEGCSPLRCEEENMTEPATVEFEELWNSLNAKRGYGWGKNPFVWVIKFDNIGARVK